MRFKQFIIVSSALILSISTALAGSSFELRSSKVYAEPGDMGVLVPIILTSSDSVGGWGILMSYDTSGGSVSSVQLTDSIQAVDPEGDTLAWFFASWSSHPERRPEYTSFVLNPGGHPDRVWVSGLMDYPTPPVVPPIPPGEDLLLFCVAFDVEDSWDGHDLLFSFQTDSCTDNTLTDPSGYTVWGPDTTSADPSTCPQRPDSLRVIRLTPEVGIGVKTVVEDSEIDEINLRPILEQNSPNPFRHSTIIRYWFPHNTSVKLTIWDVRGALQRVLMNESQPAGRRSIQWDGRDENGSPLPNGIYFYRIETSGYKLSKKLILLR